MNGFQVVGMLGERDIEEDEGSLRVAVVAAQARGGSCPDLADTWGMEGMNCPARYRTSRESNGY